MGGIPGFPVPGMEALAATEAVDSAQVTKKVAEEVLGRHLGPIRLYVDNKSLADAPQTTNIPTEKRLRIGLAALREMLEENQLIIQWITSDKQLADVLTKQGASKLPLINVLCEGKLSY